MTNSHSPGWEQIRDLEEALALLVGIDEERKLIKRRAWGVDDETFAACQRQSKAVGKLKATLSQRWHELFNVERGTN